MNLIGTKKIKIPPKIKKIGAILEKAGFKAYLVGGCVRDLILSKNPKDWDITTNARPQQVLKLFPDSFYENEFGTVGVKTREEKLGTVEITTFRKDSIYVDFRHPQKVSFSETIEEDLKRRDFTINAMAIDLAKISNSDTAMAIVDPFGGQTDLHEKKIKAVGQASQRLREDALRLIRAVRFAVQLNFEIEDNTNKALKKHAHLLAKISKERIRDELTKIVLSPQPAEGIDLLRKLGLLRHILPELEEGIGVEQNLHHVYTVYQHGLLSLRLCPSKKLSVRLAALLHDIAKPKAKRGIGKYSTFYNHDLLGSRVAENTLRRLRFSQKIIQKVALLIRNHMFYYDVDKVSAASVRRLLKKVGRENIQDLIALRIADRLGSGVPKAKPYKLRHLEYLIEKVSQDPISVKMLAVDGDELNKDADVERGPKMGAILEVLLSEVLDDPKKNNHSYLIKRAQELNREKLDSIEKTARKKIERKKTEEDKALKEQHWVK